MLRLSLILSFFCISSIFSQSKVDSVLKVAQSKKSNNECFKFISEASLNLNTNDGITTFLLLEKGIELADAKSYPKGKQLLYLTTADIAWSKAYYSKAEEYYFKHYAISDSLKDKNGIATALYNCGWARAIHKGDFSQIHYFHKAIAIYQKIKDEKGVIKTMNALGSAHADQYNKTKKVEYFNQALAIYNKAIMLHSKMDTREGMASLYSNKALLFEKQKKYTEALGMIALALDISIRYNDSFTTMANYNFQGRCYLAQGKFGEALQSFKTVEPYAKRNGFKDLLSGTYNGYAKLYDTTGNSKLASFYWKKHLEMVEASNAESLTTNLQDLTASFAMEKMNVRLISQQKQNEVQTLRNRFFGFMIICLGAAVYFVIRYARKQNKLKEAKEQANEKLIIQNEIITQKKNEIEESIAYARGLQQSILPPQENLSKFFKDSFIYFQPKDVVSGDFYWMHHVGDYYYCAVADCTGHGVPGAFMSVIGVDKLAQAVFEKQMTEPSDILQYLNEQIGAVLKQDINSKHKDGMDIVLLRFDRNKNKVVFSGANRPLILCREGEIIEYKADKTAIGGYTPGNFQFNQIEIDLKKNDTLYMYSDGYADQFGGENDKKYLVKRFKNDFIGLQKTPMIVQRAKFEDNFENWKQATTQVDDVLLIGIRYN